MLETAIYTWVYEKNRFPQTQKSYEISINRQQTTLNHLVYISTLSVWSSDYGSCLPYSWVLGQFPPGKLFFAFYLLQVSLFLVTSFIIQNLLYHGA